MESERDLLPNTETIPTQEELEKDKPPQKKNPKSGSSYGTLQKFEDQPVPPPSGGEDKEMVSESGAGAPPEDIYNELPPTDPSKTEKEGQKSPPSETYKKEEQSSKSKFFDNPPSKL